MKSTSPIQLLVVSLILAVTIVAYYPGLSGGFALDDYTNVVQNNAVHISNLSWTELSNAAFSFQAGPTMRPVSMLTFALNSYFFGPQNAEAYKIVNLIIHLLNGLLVCLLLLQLLEAYRERHAPNVPASQVEWMALTVMALWLLHPLNLMPVLYVVQRETSLSGLFVLAGCNIYLWSRTRHLAGKTGRWLMWTGMPTATLIAVVCKESGALLPVYIFAIEACVFRFRGRDGKLDRNCLLFYGLILALPACLALGWILWGRGGGYLNYSGRDYTLIERLMTETRVVWLYIRWTLLPNLTSLGLYHDDIAVSHGLLEPPTTLAAALGLISLGTACVWLRRRHALLVFGIAWFFGGQLMESTIFPLELAYEHRCYLPDLGLILGVVSLIFPLSARSHLRLPRYALLAIMLCSCATLTWLRAGDWHDNLIFSASEARHHPQSPYATYMLGQTYANIALFEDPRQYPNAVASLQAASAVSHSSVIPDVSLILVESQLKGLSDTEALHRIAAKLGRQRVSASDIQGLNALIDCTSRGNCRLPPADMYAIFDSALANPELETTPGSRANMLVIYGNYLASQDRTQLPRARALMAQATELIPNEPQYRANLVTMDIDLHDPGLAERDLDALRKMNYLGHLDAEIADYEAQIRQLQSGGRR